MRSPERARRANCTASRRSVLTRSPGFLGIRDGRYHPAVVVFFRQIAVEPVATGSGFIDKDEVCGLGLHLADELIDVTLTRANGAQVGHLGAMILGDIRHGNGVLVDIHADEECARLGHG